MSIEYDLLVFIGRVQPFHHGHKHVIQLGLSKAHHMLVLVGSSYKGRDIKNPFSYEERRSMIEMALDPQEISRVSIRPLRDYLYNDNKWIAEVQKHADIILNGVQDTMIAPTNCRHSSGDEMKNCPICKSIGAAEKLQGLKQKPRIGIIGYEKDGTSWYLKAFPQWKFVDVGNEYVESIDATTIRNMWLCGQSPNFTRGVLHSSVHKFIYEKFPKKEYDRLAREYNHITGYHKQWANSPYPVQFQTTDAVVVQSGHVLLVQRKSAPGEGLWAMPGGFVNVNETIESAVLRELREETKLKVPEPVLKKSIIARHVFDAPGRSLRGRTITSAFLIELSPGELPKVKGGDDAAKAKWVSLADFEKMEDQMFEDHHHIISYFLGRV